MGSTQGRPSATEGAADDLRRVVMAGLDVDAFLSPISADDPFGPDLDLEGDLDFMNYVARLEGLLPQSFFTFDRASIDYKAENAAIEALLERTRDLRLVVFHAKLAILNRDLVGFARDLEVIAAALEQHWPDVHPRGEGSDYMMRVVSVASLDDNPTCIMPLQYAPLVETRRTGPISWRSVQIADGKVAAREGEPTTDSGTIERAFLEIDLAELIGQRDRLFAIAAVADRIDATSLEHGDYENRIVLERLATVARTIAEYLDAHVGRRDPAAAVKPPEGTVFEDVSDDGDAGGLPGASGGATGGAVASTASSGATATVTNRRDALRALAAAAEYFQAYEPNSPSLLLVRFALKMSNRSFHDVIRLMVPDVASRASIPVAQSMFRLSLDKLTETLSGGWDASPPSDETFEAEELEPFTVATRRDALRLLDLAVAWFRVAEPASPLQLIVGRARELAERDFQTLLKEMLSDSALQALKGDEWR